MDSSFAYIFPAIRGVQSKREYFVSMCPLRLIPRIFVFDEEELMPELRAQRTLNKSRIPEISRYILENRDNYTFSAITASIDADVHFEPLDADERRVGRLHIPMSARFVINDGQHRQAAIKTAIKENPELADESIAVVFFLDVGLERCQQMFADLNRHAIRPSPSINVLYDHRDMVGKLTKLVVMKSTVFRDVVEMERSNLSLRSRKLFTLSSIYTANLALLSDRLVSSPEDHLDITMSFWEEVAKQFPEWEQVRNRKMPAGEVRRDFIHSHGTALQAIGRVGSILLNETAVEWKRRLKRLKEINWLRSNTEVWEGRTMVGGNISKAHQHVVLTANIIKKHLKLPLTPEDQRIEDSFTRGKK
jgi:DNA sulfur modification protein DndB